MVATSFKTIAAVKKWFDENGQAYFTLYGGTSTAGQLIYQQTKTKDLGLAWNQLDSHLRDMSEGTGGTFFILLRREKEGDGSANMKDTSGARAIVSLGPNPDINLNPYSAMQTTPSVKGIAGIESVEDLDAIVEKRVKAEREKWEKEQEIEELKAAVNGLQEVNPTTAAVIEHLQPAIGMLTQIGTLWLAGKLGLPVDKIGAVMQQPQPGEQAAGEYADDDELDYDTIDKAVNKLKRMGVANAEATLLKAAKYAEQNPAILGVLDQM